MHDLVNYFILMLLRGRLSRCEDTGQRVVFAFEFLNMTLFSATQDKMQSSDIFPQNSAPGACHIISFHQYDNLTFTYDNSGEPFPAYLVCSFWWKDLFKSIENASSEPYH